MGLLNHLFGGKIGLARELVNDDNKRLSLWKNHIINFDLREKLSKNFNYGNVDKAVQNFESTNKVLSEIENLISPELISISSEEKTDQEILNDLDKLKDTRDIEKIADKVVTAKVKQKEILKLFQEIYKVLTAELYLIRLIRKKPSNINILLTQLFQLIFFQEAGLYKVFRKKSFTNESLYIHKRIVEIANMIILEQKIKEKEETAEEKFVKTIVKKMDPERSINSYRRLGENIFLKLTQMAGAPLSKDENILEGINRMERLIKDDSTMNKIVSELKPKYSKKEIRLTILAFRDAYEFGHFEDLTAEFAT